MFVLTWTLNSVIKKYTTENISIHKKIIRKQINIDIDTTLY